MYRISGFVILEASQMPAEVNALNPTSLAAVLRAKLAQRQVYFHCGAYYNPSIRVFKHDRVGFSIGSVGVLDDLYAIAFRMDVHSQLPQADVAAAFSDAFAEGLRQFQVRLSPIEIVELFRRGGNYGNLSVEEADERTASSAGQVDFGMLYKPNFTRNVSDFQSYFSSQSLASLDMQNRGLLSDSELTSAATLPVGCQRQPSAGAPALRPQTPQGEAPTSNPTEQPDDSTALIIAGTGLAGIALYTVWRRLRKQS